MSTRAKAAIGLGPSKFSTGLQVGDPANFIIFGKSSSNLGSFRLRKSIQELVYDAGHERITVFNGTIVGGV